MLSITPLLRRLFGSKLVLYECRNCGTTVDDDEQPCPVCGSEETARYDLSED